MRRVYSLLLVVVLFVVMAAPAYAAETRGSSLGEDLVVWICVSKIGNNQYASLNGHAWLIVENRSFVDISIGNTFISAGDTVTIGGWSDFPPPTGSAYVNMETGINYYDAVAIKTFLSPYNIGYLRDAINIAKNKFYYPNGSTEYPDTHNAYSCVNFALEVWHAIGGATLNVTTTPKTAVALWNLLNGRSHYTFNDFASLMSSARTPEEI